MAGLGARNLGSPRPEPPISQLLASLLLFALAYGIFRSVRRASEDSAAFRRRMLIGTPIGVGFALFIAFVVPRWVPETPGSPGTLVVIALLWVMAAVILMAALPAFFGAFTARPFEGDEEP